MLGSYLEGIETRLFQRFTSPYFRWDRTLKGLKRWDRVVSIPTNPTRLGSYLEGIETCMSLFPPKYNLRVGIVP